MSFHYKGQKISYLIMRREHGIERSAFFPVIKKWDYRFPESWNYYGMKTFDVLTWRLTKPAVKTSYYFFYLGSDLTKVIVHLSLIL